MISLIYICLRKLHPKSGIDSMAESAGKHSSKNSSKNSRYGTSHRSMHGIPLYLTLAATLHCTSFAYANGAVSIDAGNTNAVAGGETPVISTPSKEVYALALVNKHIITEQDVAEYINIQTSIEVQIDEKTKRSSEFRKSILKKLVEKKVLYDEAIRISALTSSHLISPQMIKSAKKDAMRAMQVKTEEELLAKTGITNSRLDEYIKSEMTISNLTFNMINSKLSVSENEVDEYFEAESNNSTQILISELTIDKKSKEEDAQIVEKVNELVKNENSLDAIVDTINSTDATESTATQLKTKSLGWLYLSDLNQRITEQMKPLVSASKNTDKPMVSGWIESSKSYRIFQLKGKREKRKKIDREMVRNIIRFNKIDKFLQDYTRRLISNSYIKIFAERI